MPKQFSELLKRQRNRQTLFYYNWNNQGTIAIK